MAAQQPKKSTKPNGLDNLIQKLGSLPPAIDLMIAAVVGGYAFVAMYVDNAKFVALACILIALIFAFLGISSVTKEMKNFKMVEAKSNPEAFANMKTADFEKYLTALFVMDGYKVRSAIDELHRQDDADFIATRKKETVLIQFNHWDEDRVDAKPIQSLHKAASAFRADGCIAITLGQFSREAKEWGNRKGVQLMATNEVLAMAQRLTGMPATTPIQSTEAEDLTEATSAPSNQKLLFIDFAAIDNGLEQLGELITQHADYSVIATSMPTAQTTEEICARMNIAAGRLLGETPAAQTRYYAIQNYLRNQDSAGEWLAIDSDPRQFPEGVSELITVNRFFGVDQAVIERLKEAIATIARRQSGSPQTA